MKGYITVIKLLLVFILSNSCSPYINVVKIQTVNPSPATFSFAGKDVAIVGNLYYTDEGSRQYLYDSTLVAEAALGIKEQLQQSLLFADYEIPIYYTYSSDTSLVGKRMSMADVDTLAKEMNVDMIISVDYIDILGDVLNVAVKHSLLYNGVFRVYGIGAEKPYAAYAFNSSRPEPVTLFNEAGMPLRSTQDEVKAGLAYRLGSAYALYIAPYWEKVSRVYYIGPNDPDGYMALGERYVERGDWGKAMESWNKLIVNSGKKMQVAMAAFNMALGCEMMGDLDLAQKWLLYCKKQNVESVNPDSYMVVIERRIKEKKILDENLQPTVANN